LSQILDQNATRVVIADDHHAVREVLRNFLNKAPGIVVVGEASDGWETLQYVSQLSPDVLLLDIEMPGLNGIDVARQIKTNRLDARVLALSAYDDQEYVLELLNCGAYGYLIKGESPARIVEAVRGVARNENGWFSPQIAEKLDRIKKQPFERSTITFRELEIIRLLASGRADQEIAILVGIPLGDLEARLTNIFDKMGLNCRQDVIQVARQEGWAK